MAVGSFIRLISHLRIFQDMSSLKKDLESSELHRDFYLRGADEVARDLLGKYLVHDTDEGMTAGRIVETEAYLGKEDPASHAFGGKKTDRTEVQFNIGGRAYVYLIYGMYHCFNAVTGKENDPGSVFVRALEPVEGEDLMAERRGIDGSEKKELTNGPGKLCMAMGIDKGCTGKDLCGDELFISEPDSEEGFEMVSAERINIDYAGEARTWPLRFYLKDNPYVSRR